MGGKIKTAVDAAGQPEAERPRVRGRETDQRLVNVRKDLASTSNPDVRHHVQTRGISRYL